MSLAIILLTIVNLIFGLALLVIWKKLNRPAKDDPRLSRGLQLLQSKISVLEDLSDRTDRQVKQLVTLMEQKTRQIQNKVVESEKQIQRIDQSMHKSLEVANIFQDKIPHEEIIQRQTSVKYIQAARMAHQGKSIDEIMDAVGLPRGEVEFISKVNKDQLMFDENNLPEWARSQSSSEEEGGSVFDQYSIDKVDISPREAKNLTEVFEVPKVDFEQLDQMGREFKQACEQVDALDAELEKRNFDITDNKVFQKAKSVTQKFVDQTSDIIQDVKQSATQAFNDSIEQEQKQSMRDVTKSVPMDELPSPEDPKAQSLSEKLDRMSVQEQPKSNPSTQRSGLYKSAVVSPDDKSKVIKKAIFPSIDRDDIGR